MSTQRFMPITVRMGLSPDSVPNTATLTVLHEAGKGISPIPAVSVSIGRESSSSGWRFRSTFAWEGKLFAEVLYGYGGGEVFLGDNTLCQVSRYLERRCDVIKFEPEPLREKLAKLLLAAVQKEKSRLQRMCDSLDVTLKTRVAQKRSK